MLSKDTFLFKSAPMIHRVSTNNEQKFLIKKKYFTFFYYDNLRLRDSIEWPLS